MRQCADEIARLVDDRRDNQIADDTEEQEDADDDRCTGPALPEGDGPAEKR